MLSIVLAVGAALGWGSADFLGGLKSRRSPVLTVMLISQVTALLVLTAVVIGRGDDAPHGGAIGYAIVAGLSEVVAVAALYRGLSVGVMSLVVPVAAMAPLLPLVIGLTLGEFPSPLQWAGVVLAVGGVVVTSVRGEEGVRENGSDEAGRPRGRVGPSLLYGAIAAAGFGSFFFAMDVASEGDLGWALLLARVTSVVVIAVTVVATRSKLGVGGRDLPLIALIGLLVVGADTAYAAATTLGLVSIAAAVASLHTLVTIGFARVVLGEKLGVLQRAGIATALAGVVAISVA